MKKQTMVPLAREINIPVAKKNNRIRPVPICLENDVSYPTRKGTPQGGISSPTISNMTLDGLEQVVKRAVPSRRRVNFVRYADDFIITGKSKSLLENNVKPPVAGDTPLP